MRRFKWIVVGQHEVQVLVLRWTCDRDHVDFRHQGFVIMSLFVSTQGVNYSWKGMSTGTTDQFSCNNVSFMY